MRQVFLNKGAIALKEVCEPVLHDHSVLVSVYHSLIIPETEKSIISPFDEASIFKSIPEKLRNIFQSLTTKTIVDMIAFVKQEFYGEIKPLGHSCSGRVIAVGKKVTKFRAGDYVACIGSGFANHADIVCVPEQFVTHVHNKSKLQEASFVAVGGLAFDNIKKTNVQVGEYVAVVGLDLLGQLTAQIAKLSGCKVIGIDTNEHHLKIAHQLGLPYTLNPNIDDLDREILAITNREKVDCTIITKHFDNIVEKSFDITRSDGRIVLSQYTKGFALNNNKIALKAIKIINIPSYQPTEELLSENHHVFDHGNQATQVQQYKSLSSFIDFIEHNLINVNALISHTFNVQYTPQAYKEIQKKDVLGIVLNFLPKLHETPSYIEPKKGFIPSKKTGLHVGIVGAGEFAKDIILPTLSKIKGATLTTIADVNLAQGLEISQVYGARKTVVKEFELFKEHDVDVVFVNSPHRFHAEQAIQALTQGKAVFLQKPMATNFKQLETLTSFLKGHASLPFCVDYSRSLAPFIKKIKTYTEKRSSPLVISYRMNAGYLQQEEVLQRSMGAGRLIGEACHIFDIFLFLTESEPISVSVESLKPTSPHLFPTDNFTAQISFVDGSICTLLYTSLGNPNMGKERMEIYFDGKSIVMDDYISLEGYGLPMTFNEYVKYPNTGQAALITKFMKAIQKTPYQAPLHLARLHQATELTLIIDELALRGGGEKAL